MLFYIIFFIFIIYVGIKHQDDEKIGLLIFLLLFIFSAFRGEMVGTDTSHYIQWQIGFSGIESESLKSISDISRNTEFLFFYLQDFIYKNSLSPQFIIIFFSLITFVFIYLSCKKLYINLALASVFLLVIYYLTSFNISRQFAAASIILYAYSFLLSELNKKNIIIYVLLVAAATLIHTSCMFAIAVPLLMFIPIKKNILIYSILILYLINILNPLPVAEYIASKFDVIQYGSTYSDIAVTNTFSIYGIGRSLLNCLISVGVLYYACEEESSPSDNLFALSIVLGILLGNTDSVFARMVLIVGIYRIVYYAKYFYENNFDITANRLQLATIIFYAFFTLLGASQGAGGVIPYYMEFNLF